MARDSARDTDRSDSPAGTDSTDPTATESGEAGSVFDTELLSDLSVNAVPIVIIVVFLSAASLFGPIGGGGERLALFHGALIGGVVLVSVVAGWVIRRADGQLEGSAAQTYDDSERE
ncbi:DUF6684 family protein [Halobaculum sp. MBLA0147]|uniref:DUF6684 family protein n=1 Tax=Halobaculum sp. MBLA0147 TaxID=3079934 RepID=UPI003523761F